MQALLLIASLLLIAQQSIAVTIDTISVSDETDAAGYYTVTLEGKDFGSGAKIVIYDDFNSQNTGSSVVLDKALIGTWSPSSSYSALPTIVDYKGDKAIQVHNTAGIGTAKIAQIETIFSETANSAFISYSVVVPQGKYFAGATSDATFPDASTWKFTWISDGAEGIASQTQFNMCIPTHTGDGSFMLAGNSTSYGWASIQDSWSWHEKNYFAFGMKANQTTPKTLPGYIYFQLTGKKGNSFTHTKTDIPLFQENNTTSFDRVKFPGWFGNGDLSNFDAYYDDIYVAIGENAFARIELSNDPSVNKSTFNVTLPFITWSNTKITTKLFKNYLGKPGGLYIRAYNANNESKFIKLPCPKCPKPPTT